MMTMMKCIYDIQSNKEKKGVMKSESYNCQKNHNIYLVSYKFNVTFYNIKGVRIYIL